MVAASLQSVNHKEYEEFAARFGISAAVVLPPNARIITMSGQVGEKGGALLKTPEEQLERACEHINNALLAACPAFETSADAWASIAEITVYHVADLGEWFGKASTLTLPLKGGKIEKSLSLVRHQIIGAKLGSHKPVMTTVGVRQLFQPECHLEIQIKAVAV
ncbi:hypothetical protein MNV49_001371 [Pseudohyphozyma bogoriensis]|nr:hypothetical protein MNV49_001371 [Pseudohyphozyma bogoriensis]